MRTLSGSAQSSSPARDILHGVEVEDRFRWLEDQDSEATRTFIRGEQEHYQQYLTQHHDVRGSVETRVREYLSLESVDLPVSDRRGGLLYLKRGANREQKSIYHRNDGTPDVVIVSVEDLGYGDNASLAILQVSPDGRYLLFGLRQGGEDVQEIYVYDLQRSLLTNDRLSRGFSRGLVFDNEGTGFYYVHEETTGAFSIRRVVRHHVFGSGQSHDREVFYGGDGPGIRLLVQPAVDRASLGYTIVSLESIPRIQFFVHSFPLEDNAPKALVSLSGVVFAAQILHRTTIQALTTLDAPRGRIVVFSSDRPDPDNWRDIVPQGRMQLRSLQHWSDKLVVQCLDGPSKIVRIYGSSGEQLREISFSEPGTVTLGALDGTKGLLFYAHSNVSIPTTIYQLSLETGDAVQWWAQPNPVTTGEPEIVKQRYLSTDGTLVPLTLIRPRGAVGPGPMLLSAYGGAGVSNTPKFSVLVAVLLEYGVSCAIAHVRGGGEEGLRWHNAALKAKRQASVDDLIAGAEWLIQNHIATPMQLGVAGQSNGALLTLCAIVQRPELFCCAMALGALSDLTRFHLFGVARGFTTELGSPENPGEFHALYRLSPYHAVKDGISYPALLVISGDCDKRCDSLHSRKMVARMREIGASKRPLLLDYTSGRGHKPTLSMTERVRSLTDRLTFLLTELCQRTPEEETL